MFSIKKQPLDVGEKKELRVTTSAHPAGWAAVSHARLVCPLRDSASWPSLSSRLLGDLCRPVRLLQLSEGLRVAAAVWASNFTALPEGVQFLTQVVSAVSLEPGGSLDEELIDVTLSYLCTRESGLFRVAATKFLSCPSSFFFSHIAFFFFYLHEGIITSAKGTIVSFVWWLSGLRKNYWTTHRETWWRSRI